MLLAFEFYIADDRYESLTFRIVMARDKNRAREIAKAILLETPHHTGVEVCLMSRRLFGNGFRDYEGLAQWVRGQGYNISDDSLWRISLACHAVRGMSV